MATTHPVTIKRVYDSHAHERGDGHRVLVDRLWPRGVAKADLVFDSWPKDVTPSSDLRKWYGHDVDRWSEFVKRYRKELTVEPGATELAHLSTLLTKGPITLLTAVKDVDHSAAAVLQAVLTEA